MNYLDLLPLDLQEYIYNINYKEFKIDHQKNYIYVLCDLESLWNYKMKIYCGYAARYCQIYKINTCIEISPIGLINRESGMSFILPSQICSIPITT